MKTQINMTTSYTDMDRYPDRETFLELIEPFDGVELMCFEPDERQIIPKERVVGLHMACPPYWVDFWNGDLTACRRVMDTDENIAMTFGGMDRNALLEHYRLDLAHAREYGAEYMVFHVSDCCAEEAITGKYVHTDAQVIDASCALLNELFEDVQDGPALLLENLWEPGLRFTDPEMTARLLEGVQYPNKGIMLDTGHLMHTNTALRKQKESLEYIHSMLDLHGELCHTVRGIHLNQSLTGALMRRYMRNPPAMLPTYAQRNGQIFEYIFQIDVHRPFTCPGVGELIERIDPEYLTFEFISNDLREHKRMLRAQLRALGRQ